LKLLTDALQSFASKSTSSLNVALSVSVALAIWSAKAGVTALISGLDIANETYEKRGFIRQQVVALSLTVGAVLFAMVAIAALALLPIVVDVFPLPDALKATLGLGRWPLLVVMVSLGLAVVYRFGPSREHAKWRWITWGAATATVLDRWFRCIFVLCLALRLLRCNVWVAGRAGRSSFVVLGQRSYRPAGRGDRCGVGARRWPRGSAAAKISTVARRSPLLPAVAK
jgi:uncharacterized BrkB/YihY/UPF0761 family membrane protein